MRSITIVSLIIVLLFTKTAAQQIAPLPILEKSPFHTKKKSKPLTPNNKVLQNIKNDKPQNLEIIIPVDDKQVQFKLQNIKLFSTKGIMVNTSSGDEFNHNNSVHYIGYSKDNKESTIRLSVYENNIHLKIDNYDGISYDLVERTPNEYVLETINFKNKSSSVINHTVCSNESNNEKTYAGCKIPDYFRAGGLTTSKAILFWNNYEDAIRYQIRYRPIYSYSWISKFSNYSTYEIEELLPNTEYEVIIRSQCDSGWTSWSQTFNFSTLGNISQNNTNRSVNQGNETTLGIYYEVDFLTYNANNQSIGATLQNILDLHIDVANIYNNIGTTSSDIPNNGIADNLDETVINGFSLNLEITSMYIWDTPDPYPINQNLIGNTTAMLNERLATFINMRQTFNGDLAQLINNSNGSGGLAAQNTEVANFQPGLCLNTSLPNNVQWTGNNANGPNLPYSISFLNGNGNQVDFPDQYSSSLIAHEFAHNLGARHTSTCNWFQNSSELFPIETSCPNPECNVISANNTVTSNFDITLMSNGCWFNPGFPNPNKPMHFINATQLCQNIDNLTTNNPNCLNGGNNCIIDMDGDGVCADIDCQDNNPNVPGTPGEPCDDGNIMTVNDSYNDDPCSICEGQPWINELQDPCNLIVGGGPYNFENLNVGITQGTFFNGIPVTWDGSGEFFPNSPDVGNYMDNTMNCNNFIGLLNVAEGFAVPLTNSIEPGQSFNLEFDYAFMADPNNNNFRVQASQTLVNQIIPTNVVDIAIPVQTQLNNIFPPLISGGNWQEVMNNNDCNYNLQLQNINILLTNNSNQDLNFIYISYPPSQSTQGTLNYFAIDNLTIQVNQLNYTQPQIDLHDCGINSITFDDGNSCVYQVQENTNGIWTEIPMMPNPSSINNNAPHAVVHNFNNHLFSGCNQYRLVQICPPFVCDNEDPFCADYEANCVIHEINLAPECQSIQPVVEIQGPSINCADGTLVNLEAQVSNSTQPSFNWSIQGTVNQSIVQVSSTNSNNQLYVVTVTDELTNCESSDSHFMIYDSPCDLSNIFISCNGNEANIEVDFECPNLTGFFWETLNQSGSWVSVNPAQTSPTFTTNTNGTYRLTAEDQFCGTITSPPIVAECTNVTACGCDPAVGDLIIDIDISPNISDWFSGNTTQVSAPNSTQVAPILYERFNPTRICIISSLGINGELIIDEDCGFSNSDIFVEDDIAIQNNSALRILDSNFDACSQRWAGIISNTLPAFLIFTSSEFSENTCSVTNCDTGIEIRENSANQIVGVDFNNCIRGIQIIDEFRNWGFRGLNFRDCINGIRVERDASFTYPTRNNGSQILLGGFEPNTVNYVWNIDDYIDSGNVATFTNCTIGIRSTGDCFLAGLDFDLTRTPISTGNPNILNLRDFRIDRAREGADLSVQDRFRIFGGIIRNTTEFGITIRPDANFIQISHVIFEGVNNPIFFSETPRITQIINCPGIRVNEFTNCTGTIIDVSPISNLRIGGNEIMNLNPVSERVIDLDRCENTSLFNNAITGLQESQTGIFSNGGIVNTYRNNIINGDNSDLQIGIDLQDESPFVCSNQIVNTNSGLVMQGMNAMINRDNTFVLLNQFENNETGLSILGTGVGEQNHNQNQWIGGNTRAITDDPSNSLFIYDPSVPSFVPDNERNNNSWFRANVQNTPQAGSVICATDNPNFKFIDGDEIEPPCECQGSISCYPGPCCTIYSTPTCEEMRDWFGPGYYPVTVYEERLIQLEVLDWWKKFSKANGLGNEPIPPYLLECWRNPNTFGEVNEGEGSNEQQHENVIYQADLYRILETAENFSESELKILDNVHQEISILTTSLNEIDTTAEESEVIALQSDLKSKFILLDSIKQKYQVRKSNLAFELETKVVNLVAEYDFIEDQNTMIKIRTKLLTSSIDNLDDSDWNKILDVANSCPYVVGNSCFVARSIYHSVGGPHPQDYNNNLSCSTLDYREREISDNQYEIYPNPVLDELTIIAQQPSVDVDVRISNLLGQVFYTKENISLKDPYILDVSEYEKGIYILQIESGDMPDISTKKFIKLD